MYDEQASRVDAGTEPQVDRNRWTVQAGDPPASPDSEEACMPSKLRRTQVTLQAKAYRSAFDLAGLLVLLEALGAPRKL